MMTSDVVLPTASIRDDMSQADLGDARLNQRNGTLAERITQHPGADMPQATRDEAELQAAYRFGRHDDTDLEAVLQPHYEATARRAHTRGDEPVLAVHDTTSFDYGSSFRPGLGTIGGSKQFGFFGHWTLAVRSSGPKLPDGVLATQMWRREVPEEVSEQAREPAKDVLPTLEDEGAKWWQGVQDAETHLPLEEIIHVMDRGADSYERLVKLRSDERRRFIMRANQNRRVLEDSVEGLEAPKLDDALADAETKAERTIELSSRDQAHRPPSPTQSHPSRKTRQAHVEIRTTSVQLRRPKQGEDSWPESLEMNVVWVREVDPPEGAEPVDWRLYTTEPIGTASEAEQIVDWYVRRWVIEEWFGAFKGACRAEERTMESADTLSTTLGWMAVAAWRLLALRTLARHPTKSPAREAFRREQLEILADAHKTRLETTKGVSVTEALKALAALGGHLPRNGEPGWKVLHRGLRRLHLEELGHLKGQQHGQTKAFQKVEQWAQEVDDLDALQRRLETLASCEAKDEDL